ncbi:efflux RND transporter periplasmic adaptor subunit [Aestuariirhabdus sp. Z084]|uniref:efflux RND transporter periplasmic adaptor subunit n=1 Tax=Aestuariirhabdus haliotis TaxID=2918751 RepID=UPI00201B377E|nr:efflux RND transporter periplasmic adaptor subunit [Aestuariirhabdus haliotis]MCL6416726.1 efflux RND transporter periplasmic adaptor subunit [Aestuariirhabdus haliotis]MCL6420726.1 efflux RND transporter periplasmic adaptor subunit [Aestuariirhabdus haliotis]
MMNRPTLGLPVALALMGALLLTGCGTEPEPLAETIPRVKYFEVGEQATGQSRRISGKLVAADTSLLSFSVAGTVEQVLVNRGDRVEKGQVLAVLDIEPLRLAVEQSRAQLNIASARATETKQSYDRAINLFNKQALSQADVDKATANHATALGNLKSAQSDLDRKERDYAQAELVAPFDGTIAERNIDPFQETDVGENAFVLQSSGSLEVNVRIPETLIRDIEYGQVVQVTFPTLEGTRLNGIVNEIGSRVETGNSFPVNIQLPVPDAELLPGMTASVTFNFDKYLDGRTAYLIPLSAIAIEFGSVRKATEERSQTKENIAPVYVVAEDGTLKVRNLLIGDLRGNYLEVYEGLEAGDKVVSAGVTFLREGMTVELWTPEQGLTDG